MRITIHVSDRLGEEARRAARTESISVSRLVAEALSLYLKEMKRQQLGNQVLGLIGKVEVAEDALDSLDEVRSDART